MLVGFDPARLRIADDLDEVTLQPAPLSGTAPVVCRGYDFGSPQPRVAAQPRIGLDGVDDATAYTDSRTVTFDLIVMGGTELRPDGTSYTGTCYDYAERLAAFTHPLRRPYLYVRRAGQETYPDKEWRLLLRGGPFSLAYGPRAASLLEMTLAFEAPDGYFESEELGEVNPAPGQRIGGWKFPHVYPFSFGSGSTDPSPPFALELDTSAPVAPRLFFFGPSTNPRVELDTGEVFAFADLTLATGQMVEVDMGRGVVLAEGNPYTSVYHTVDWTVSTFWRLTCACSTVSYTADGGEVRIRWRNRKITI